MGQAYTPGLKITEHEQIQKRRILPLKGDVLVEKGKKVQPEDIVARTLLPGKVMTINIAGKLGIDQSEVSKSMSKKAGDAIGIGDKLAQVSSFFGLFKSEVLAPLDGHIESISSVTGQVFLRGKPETVEIKAHIESEVKEVLPEEGVVLETCGSFVQGIFGIGGETVGELVMACDEPSDALDETKIMADHSGKIIVGGSIVTSAALHKAIELGVRGVVVGGFHDQDLRKLLGFDLGVAITGHETLGLTLIVTEGFGQINMAEKTFSLLKSREGMRASINGATQIRAGVIRPEVIVPKKVSEQDAQQTKKIWKGLEVGSLLRMIRFPYFGKIGEVVAIPHKPQILESGSKTRVVSIKLEDGQIVTVPRANVEMIEE